MIAGTLRPLHLRRNPLERDREPLPGIGLKRVMTLMFDDAIFNLPHSSGLAGFIFRFITAFTGGPRVTRLFRWFAVKDKAALSAHMKLLADTPGLSRIIVFHGRQITDRPAEVLRQVARAL